MECVSSMDGMMGGSMSKFDAIGHSITAINELESYGRVKLVELYYKYSPRECADMVNTDEEFKRVSTIDIEKLRSEVKFYLSTFGW